MFQRMKAEGKGSKAPLTESFLRWGNLKIVLLALFGGVAGQAVVWYTGMFYELFFLTQTLKVGPAGEPDGRRRGSCSRRRSSSCSARSPTRSAARRSSWGLRARGLTYFPIFKALTKAANPAIFEARPEPRSRSRRTTTTARSSSTRSARSKFTSSCDIAKGWLAKNVHPVQERGCSGGHRRGREVRRAPSVSSSTAAARRGRLQGEAGRVRQGDGRRSKAAGYPASADMSRVNDPMVMFLLVHPRAVRDDGVRARSRPGSSSSSPPGSATRPCRCRTTSATAGSAASSRRSRSRWSRRPATSTTASGTRSRSPA